MTVARGSFSVFRLAIAAAHGMKHPATEYRKRNTNKRLSMSDESHHEKELGGKLLSSVSRSFYLTLKALPRELREPISLAYLLARTADTMADTAEVPPSVRLDCLSRFAVIIQSDATDGVQDLARTLAADFSPHQKDAAEAVLMQRMPDAIAWLHAMSGARLTAIRDVLRPIIHGQQLDIQRFPGEGSFHSLHTAAELNEYTYLVAGCVGEFWTKLCFTELPSAFAPGVTLEQASAWGIAFGKGLQLVNILRDLGKDARLGRCYLPDEEWSLRGIRLDQVQANPVVLRPEWQAWLQRCERYLREALTYVQNLQHGKLRYATALPLLLAVKTVCQLRRASDADLLAGVKISRMDVAKVLLEATLHNSPAGLTKLFEKWA